MGFVYNFAVVKGAPNRDAAYRFLDSLIGTPGIEAALTRSAGYTSSFLDAGAGLTEVERAAYGLDPGALGRLRFARHEGQALSSALIDRAVEEVRAIASSGPTCATTTQATGTAMNSPRNQRVTRRAPPPPRGLSARS
jgi:spermidine/putrescine-binding protein